MNAIVQHQLSKPAVDLCNPRPLLSQDSLVYFCLPYATSLQLTGRLQGVVLSRNFMRESRHDIIVCPIIYGQSSVNETWGIKLETDSEIPSYLRPDLTSVIGIQYGKVTPILTESGEPCRVDETLRKATIQKLSDIIKPSAAKFAQPKRQQFLGYGEIGKAHGFPRACEDVIDPAFVLNLTPPEVYQQTGMALLVRAYSNKTVFRAEYDIAVASNKWFEEGFFSTDLRILPVEGTLRNRRGWKPISAGLRALKAAEKKILGMLDEHAGQKIVKRYNTPKGVIKPYLKPSNYVSEMDCQPL